MKKVSVMCFHDELCQVFNALMTALNLLRDGAEVTIFFGSRGINVVHKEKIKNLKCMPDAPKKVSDAVMKKMKEKSLPTPEDLMTMLIAEGALVLACPLNKELFGIRDEDLIEGVKVADPQAYYSDIAMKADATLAF